MYSYAQANGVAPSEAIHVDNSGKPLGKNIDAYAFDDLLVSCTQEIMANGIETRQIPDTIKDWVGGKVIQWV